MYAKNQPVPPKFDYPYQEQQRYSGSFVSPKTPEVPRTLSADTIAKIAETVKRLEAEKQ